MALLDFYIYQYDFLKTKGTSLPFKEEGVDGDSNLAMAEKCFESLFDEKSIPNLVKTKKKGESTRLCNSVFKKDNDILLWQVNNNLPKGIWKPTGKDSNGNEQYEKETVESVPPCFVMIDNRPDRHLIAIEKNSAWSNTDKLRDVLLANFNNHLKTKFGIEMQIGAMISPTEFWDFVHQKIKEGDYLTKITLDLKNPKNLYIKNSTSKILKSWYNIQHLSNALKSKMELIYGKNSIPDIINKSKDLSELVNVCCQNRYNLAAHFKYFGKYEANQKAKAHFMMNDDKISTFQTGPRRLWDKSVLEYWFDIVNESIKDYFNESETKPQSNQRNKTALQR